MFIKMLRLYRGCIRQGIRAKPGGVAISSAAPVARDMGTQIARRLGGVRAQLASEVPLGAVTALHWPAQPLSGLVKREDKDQEGTVFENQNRCFAEQVVQTRTVRDQRALLRALVVAPGLLALKRPLLNDARAKGQQRATLTEDPGART